MKISFVIPAYNEENNLKGCLKALQNEVKNQSFEYEIIVVNNASTDQTKVIAQGVSGVKVVDEPRKGLSFARQAGFMASSGDLVANLDADTIVPAGWGKIVTEYFSNNSKLVCLSGPHIFYDLPQWFNAGVRVYYYIVYIIYWLNRFVFRVGSMVQGGNFVIKRSALEKIGGFNTDFNFYGEDADVARRMHEIGDVVFTLKLPIYASGRRVKAEGMLLTPIRYGINYLWTIFFHRPFSKTSADIRTKGQ